VNPPLEEGALLHVDACCWIDLFATDRIQEIVASLPFRWAVSEYVMTREVLTIFMNAGVEERCDFAPLVKRGLVSVFPIRTIVEQEALVRFAAYLDDGEASVCALASIYGGGIASTDRKVISTLTRLGLRIPTVQTPELLFQWAERTQVSRDQVKKVLRSVTTRARYSPRRDVPYAEWWHTNSAG
jgi:hypothetical protein